VKTTDEQKMEDHKVKVLSKWSHRDQLSQEAKLKLQQH
jgi:hypothetical protein